MEGARRIQAGNYGWDDRGMIPLSRTIIPMGPVLADLSLIGLPLPVAGLSVTGGMVELEWHWDGHCLRPAVQKTHAQCNAASD